MGITLVIGIASVVTNLLEDGLFSSNLVCSKNILTKLVGYQQPTGVCVRMEFVFGTISLSCELFLLSCGSFRSCGAGTIVYWKWCSVLHVQCCGSCMVSTECST